MRVAVTFPYTNRCQATFPDIAWLTKKDEIFTVFTRVLCELAPVSQHVLFTMHYYCPLAICQTKSYVQERTELDTRGTQSGAMVKSSKTTFGLLLRKRRQTFLLNYTVHYLIVGAFLWHELQVRWVICLVRRGTQSSDNKPKKRWA